MNAVGVDVSKGKSMVAVRRPFNEIVAKPFEIRHTGSELKHLADCYNITNRKPPASQAGFSDSHT